MKLNTLLQARKVFLAHVDDKMPVNLAYKFMKAVKASEDEDAFYNKKLQEIIDTYGKKTPDGNVVYNENGGVVIQEDKLEECRAKVKELEETNVELKIAPFKIDELSGLQFSPKELFFLDEYIE